MILSKQGEYSFPNLEPVCCSMSVSNCCFLTCIQVSQETSKVIWYSHLFKNFPQFVVILHTVKGFHIVDEAEIDVFLEFLCFLYDQWMLAIWFLVPPLPFLNPANTSRSSWFTYCWSHNLASMWNECSGVVVWTFFVIALWDWNENCPFPAWPCPIYLDLGTYQVPMQYCSVYSIRLYFHHIWLYFQTHLQPSVISTLAQPLHSFWSYFSTLPQ